MASVPTEGDFVTKAGGDATKVSAAVDKAKEAIAKAATKADLDKAEADLQNDLNKVVSFENQKAAAVSAINKAAADAKEKIEKNSALSEFEKAVNKAKVDAIVDSSLKDVGDAQETVDLVTAVNTVQAVCGQVPTDSETVTITK